MNDKSEIIYEKVFDNIINIITQNNAIDINISTIVTDFKGALIKSIKTHFPNSRRIFCYFHNK